MIDFHTYASPPVQYNYAPGLTMVKFKACKKHNKD
jgi:hypothetical protein